MTAHVLTRSDLQWTLHSDAQRWVARDPLNGRFFYLSLVEYEAVRLLDGRSSLSQVLEQVVRKFPGVAVDRNWLMRLVQRLSASQLLAAQSGEAVNQLLWKYRKSQQRNWTQWLFSPLAIRVPLFNPEPLLNCMRPIANLLFARLTVWLVVVLGLIVNVSAFSHWLASPYALTWDLSVLSGDRWLWLLATYVVVKSLHELGHGLACLYWRTRCSELGLLFLFFTPCLYCDTTDAWKLSSRWQRAAIGAAGMYVELIIASLAAATWLMTQDGLLHSMAANVMLLCSLGTLLINGNPFMRYDGYYILSDIWGVPNLADQAREATMISLTRLMTGRAVPAEHLDRPVWSLTLYHVVAVVYRTFIMLAILWLAWTILVPMGLGFLSLLIVLGTGLGIMLAVFRLFKQIQVQILANSALKFVRLVALFVCLSLLVYFVSQVELPVLVRARGVTDFADKQAIFSTDDAAVVKAVSLGAPVEAGTPLLQLDSPEKRYQLQLLAGEIALLRKKIEYLNQATNVDPVAASELPQTQELLNDRMARSRLLEQELATLVQTAPESGRMLPTATPLPEPLTNAKDGDWRAGPLDEMTRGCHIERGTLVGWFSPQQVMEVIAVVSQQEIKQLRLGMKAVCQWDCDVNTIVPGTISRISPDPVLEIPAELVGDETLISVRNAEGKFAPIEPHYTVTITVEQPVPDRLKGSLVTTQFHVKSQPLLQTMLHAIRVSLKPL